MISASVTLPATCGEWVQGTLDGVPCLVSCAINWHASVRLELQGTNGSEPRPPTRTGQTQARPGASDHSLADLWQLPPDRPKAVCALRRALAARNVPGSGGALIVQNPLPRGRGYASSTVDVAGTIFAVGESVGTPFTPAEVARLATAVEPSDSIMFTRPTLLAHRDASFFRPLGPSPRLAVVVLDPGGNVDTLAFNCEDHGPIMKELAPQHRDLFAMLEAGLEQDDAALVARAATGSALTHQRILYSELVECVSGWMGRIGAIGICRAHSGTLVGLLCDPDSAPEVGAQAVERLPGVTIRICRAA
jgi:L-threonine kinase